MIPPRDQDVSLAMKFPDLATVAQLDLYDEIVDVRSPAEFEQDHAPGAHNHPVLDDDERAQVGSLHQQVSPFEAKKRGAIWVARNIAAHIEKAFNERAADWRPLVYCWRGGKRSGAMTHVLRQIGWQAAQLDGGYRAYRRAVVMQLETLPAQFRYIVVCGATGSAKSRILQALAVSEAAGAQVLDLEQLACHRGSVLGELPELSQPSQKMFETRLWDRLRRFDPHRPIFVESESKKIGQLQIPESLIQRMRDSFCVRIDASLDARIRFLLGEYQHFVEGEGVDRLNARLDCLAGLHSSAVIERWKAQGARSGWKELVADLLEHHYDPAYARSMARNFKHLQAGPIVSTDDLGAASIDAIVQRLAALQTAERVDMPDRAAS